jgi:hypothetical protein
VTETTIAASSPATASPGLVSRLAGVILSPRTAYAAVAERPRVLGALLVSLTIVAGAQTWFLTTDTGKEALIERQTKAMDSLRSMGINIPDRAYDQLEERVGVAPYTTAASIIVITPIFYAIIAGLLLMVFNAFLGGTATFKQVYAVLAHSAAIAALQALFNTPMNYARGEMSSATQLSVFFPMFDEMGFANYFFSAIDLFLIWWVISVSIGVAVLYKRRTGPIATSLLAVYGVIAVIIAAFRAF